MDAEGKPTNTRREDVHLMSVEGSKFIDTNALINREENSIARALMAGFLVMVGQDSGSYALSKDTTSMFKLLVEGIAQHLCDTFNHQVIKPLWVLNGQPFEYLPELTYDSVDLTLDGMATFINALSGAGIVLTESQEDYLFEYGGLPKPEAEERLKMQEDALMMNPMMQGNRQNEDISTDARQQPRTTEDD
jgi:phage gp29-like protein